MDVDALLTMDAGDELDIAIARLLGWQVHTLVTNVFSPEFIDGEWHDTWLESENGQRFPLMRYSRDLNAAWMLVKDIRYFALHSYVGEGGGCETFVDSDGVEEWPGYAAQDKPALAVCRAWIAWKLGQEGGAE